MASLERYKFKEAFVAGTDHTVITSGDLIAFESLETLLEHLKTKNPSVSGNEVRVLHGVVTPARSIPADFDGQTIFILVEGYYEEGIVFDSSAETPEELADEIEKVMNDPEIAVELTDIDDIYILYGQELNTCLSVDEDDIDDEMIDACKKVAKAAEKQLEKSGEV